MFSMNERLLPGGIRGLRDKIAKKDDKWRVRGKRRVNSLNEILLSSKEIPGFFRTYRDLS